MTCKFCNREMYAVYSCGDNNQLMKFYRCHNCHNETKPKSFVLDDEDFSSPITKRNKKKKKEQKANSGKKKE